MDKIFKKKVTTVAMTFLLFFCAIYANIYAIRMMERYAGELYFYDKLQVALQFGGTKGFDDELNRISSLGTQKKQQALAEEFKKTLPQLKDPAQYLSNIVTDRRAKITRITNFRFIAMIVIFIIFSWRLYASYSARLKRA